MMRACPGLRVVLFTVHQSLAGAVRSLTTEAIVAVAELTAAALERDFGIAAPHLSVAALNPHAGEGGSMGREEGEIIAPAVSRLKKGGLSVSGPAPADTLFHERPRKSYDAAICLRSEERRVGKECGRKGRIWGSPYT